MIGRTSSVNARVTAAEKEMIRDAAKLRGMDESTFARNVLLSAAGSAAGPEATTPAQTCEILVRAMRASIELGDRFGVTEFDAIIRQVKAEVKR